MTLLRWTVELESYIENPGSSGRAKPKRLGIRFLRNFSPPTKYTIVLWIELARIPLTVCLLPVKTVSWNHEPDRETEISPRQLQPKRLVDTHDGSGNSHWLLSPPIRTGHDQRVD